MPLHELKLLVVFVVADASQIDADLASIPLAPAQQFGRGSGSFLRELDPIVPLENPERSKLTRIILRCEFSPPMTIFLFVLFVGLRSILVPEWTSNSRILPCVIKSACCNARSKSARNYPRTDRIFWVALSRLWRDWRSTLVLVKPETVVAWHRRGFRWFWTWRVRQGQPALPSLVKFEL